MKPGDTEGNVLVLADESATADRLGHWVEAVGEQPVVVTGTERTLLERGRDGQIDLVITDLDSDDPASVKLLERLLDGELFFGVPQLHLTDDSDSRMRILDLAADAATGCLTASPEPSEFQSRVRLASEIGRLRRQLAETSIRDDLTSVYNRRFLLMRLAQEFARALRYGTPLSFVLFDIDQLRAINDRFGIEVGDLVLQHASRVLMSQVRKEDIGGRWGEKTFAVILPGTPFRGAAVFANKVRGDAESLCVRFDETEVPVKMSAGISAFQPGQDMKQAADLLRATEEALTEAKQRGGNRVYIDEAVMRTVRRLVLVADGDAELLDTAEDLLGMEDFRVVRTDSATSLLETLKFRTPDLIVLDLGLGGDDCASLIDSVHDATEGDAVPIIGLAGAGAPSPEALGRLRVDRYITKPFSLAVLRSIARELILARRPTPAQPR